MKIVADKQARHYELTFLLPSELTSSEVKKTHELIAGLIAKHEGEIIEQKDWGQKDLAYTMKMSGKKYTQANYYHWQLGFLPAKVISFEREMKLLTGVLRYLLVLARKTAADVLENPAKTNQEDERE